MNTLATGYELDHLGLPQWQPDSALQAEIDALPRIDSRDPLLIDQTQKRHELNCTAVSKYRWENQEQFARERFGRILSQGEFLYLLRKVNPSFYYNDWSVDGLVGLNVIERGQPKYICAVQLGAAPEYETIYVDEHGLPGRSKYRGWRTVLLRCIEAGVITEENADRVFGKATGPESGPYLSKLYAMRNRKAT